MTPPGVSVSLEDGVVVRVARRARLDRPLRLPFAPAGPEAGPAHPRVTIVLEEGSSAEIVEERAGEGEGPSAASLSTRVSIGEGASLKHYRLRREEDGGSHISETSVELGRAARYESHVFSLGGALTRSDLRVRMSGDGAECALNGLALMRDREVVDHRLVVEHAALGGTTRVLYKAVLDEKSRFAFNGLADVRPGAQKTDAHIYNRNLILSEDAEVRTNPEFRILADDVSCRHGGTIGQLSPESLFYLRSRGVGEAQARRMLVYAFGSEMVARVGLGQLKDELEISLLERMPGGMK